jgi:cell division septal protein FtsQ
MNHRLQRVSLNKGKYFRKFGIITKYILLCLVIILVLYTLSIRFFDIQSVEIIGSDVNVTIDPKKFQKHLLFFPTGELKRELLTTYPELRDVHIALKFPHTLYVSLETRQPFAVFSNGKEKFTVDNTGFVLNISGNNLPIIEGISDISSRATRISDIDVKNSLQLLAALQKNFSIKKLTIIDNQSIQTSIDKTNIFFPQDRDIPTMVTTLQMLLTRFRMKGTMPTSIDLRFTKPVVTF